MAASLAPYPAAGQPAARPAGGDGVAEAQPAVPGQQQGLPREALQHGVDQHGLGLGFIEKASQTKVASATKRQTPTSLSRKLPLQYNTYLEEAGNGLSGGEKQRIAMARAFLKDSNLYIFDEATSSLDFGTENTIFDMIYDQLADRSMLIVAHRLSTVRDCDLILVMDHGEIVERGTHDELLAKQGKYYELWNLQQGIFRRKKEAPAPAPAAVVEEDDDGEDAMTY